MSAHLILDLDQQLLLRYSRSKRVPPDFPAVRHLPHSRAAMSRDAGLVAGPAAQMAVTMDLLMSRPGTDSAAEDEEVPGRLYVPSTEGSGLGGLMVYFHGGGWVQGSVASHEGLCQALAHRLGMRVLSVEYRLAPEHVFPAPLEDAWAAYKYAHSNRCSLTGGSGSGGPLVLAGDSAGGNLAAVVALRAAKAGCAADAQLLLYPVTDLVEQQPSRLAFAEGFFLTRSNMQFYQDCYVPVGVDKRDPEVSPAYMDERSAMRLPRALVVTAGYDVLRDEGKMYYEKLQRAGVRAAYLNCEGCIHGFLNFGCTLRARSELGRVCAALQGLLREGED